VLSIDLNKIRYIVRKLVVWYLVTLLSLTAMFLVAQIPYSYNKVVEIGVKEIESSAKTIQNITEAVSIQNESSTPGSTQGQGYSLHLILFVSLLIFSRNIRLLLLLLVPYAGVFFYGVMIVYNGLVGRALAESVFGSNWQSALFAVLFLYPHSHLEIFSYVIAVYTSTILGLKLIKSKDEKDLFRNYWRYAILSVVCLYLAALIEAWMIIS